MEIQVMKKTKDWFKSHRRHVVFAVEFMGRCAVEHMLILAGAGIGGGLAIRLIVEWVIDRLKR